MSNFKTRKKKETARHSVICLLFQIFFLFPQNNGKIIMTLQREAAEKKKLNGENQVSLGGGGVKSELRHMGRSGRHKAHLITLLHIINVKMTEEHKSRPATTLGLKPALFTMSGGSTSYNNEKKLKCTNRCSNSQLSKFSHLNQTKNSKR